MFDNDSVTRYLNNSFRYGDNLNPWGDVIAMAKAWCITKPNAKALIGVPTGPTDKIIFNRYFNARYQSQIVA